MSSESFVADYQKLIIKQYFEKPKAKAEIGAVSNEFKTNFDFLKSFETHFDLDQAVNEELDLIGKQVGISRIIADVIPDIFFGFDGDPDTRGFAELFDPDVSSAPFFVLDQSPYTPTQLTDEEYRFFIKLKIATNVTSDLLESDEFITIRDVIAIAFDGDAYVVDLLTMKLNLNVSIGFSDQVLRIIRNLDLLPRPQGVEYLLTHVDLGDTFGFSNDPTAKTFGEGIFATLII